MHYYVTYLSLFLYLVSFITFCLLQKIGPFEVGIVEFGGGSHEATNGQELIPYVFRCSRAVQVDNWNMLFMEPLHGGSMVLVIGSQAFQCHVNVVVVSCDATAGVGLLGTVENAFHGNGIIVAIQMEGQFLFPAKVQKVMRIFEGPRKSIQQDSFPRARSHLPFNEGRNGGTRYQFSPPFPTTYPIPPPVATRLHCSHGQCHIPLPTAHTIYPPFPIPNLPPPT